MKNRTKHLSIFIGLLGIIMFSCQLTSAKPRNAEVITVMASPNLQSWLDQAAVEFNTQRNKTPENKPYYVEVVYVDAGQAVVQATDGGQTPALWIPDSEVWTAVMADQAHPEFENDCVSAAQSPLVIAMWQPIAEALGWPGRNLGWLDIGSLAADPSAWQYYTGGQFGPALRVGHAHPGLSSSGTSTLLAVIQAAESKQTAVDAAEIEQPIVQASVTAFESAVAIFSRSTTDLIQTMDARGINYLGAAVVYENLLFDYVDQDPAIVPIYPLEGTFMADFPACVNDTASQNQQDGSALFRDFLLGETGQKLAAEAGLRTQNGALPDKPYFQPDQPEIVFASPSPESIYAAQGLWESARKSVNLVMIIDTSGSMQGSKIAEVKSAATDFIQTMADEDFLSIVAFDPGHGVVTLMDHYQIGSSRNLAVSIVQKLSALGSTPLYDSIAAGAEIIAGTTSSQTSNVLIVLTDGMDTSSFKYRFDETLTRLAMGNSTSIYTIAFGKDADEDVLSKLAIMTNGTFYVGDQTNIASIYQEMTVIFGGSVGIGR